MTKLVILAIFVVVGSQAVRPFPRFRQEHAAFGTNLLSRPSSLNCTWKFFDQTLDHFAQGVTVHHDATFKQRYCIVDSFWKAPSEDVGLGAETGPIFFYTGNESPVEEYVNNTGLMWELAPRFGALLVFIEHRYEGESVPEQKGVPDCLSYCSSTQALADYAVFIDSLKKDLSAESSPVIAFGGSYGGMLSSWMRMKYPHIVSGAISASAPILSFAKSIDPNNLDGAGVAITRGVSAAGGATDQCRDNLLAAWPLMKAVGETAAGRALLTEAFKLCKPLASVEDVKALIAWGQSPWFNLAEGNYPFESTYITFAVGPGLFPLPAWPMRVSCANLNSDLGVKTVGNISAVNFDVSIGDFSVKVDWDHATPAAAFSGEEKAAEQLRALFSGVREAVGVWFNVTRSEKCFSVSGSSNLHLTPPSPPSLPDASPEFGTNICKSSLRGSWEPLCCNDNINPVNYQVMGVGRDMFWPPTVPRDFNLKTLTDFPGAKIGCGGEYAKSGLYGVPLAKDMESSWVESYYGGRRIQTHTNIVFSNGLIDPWSGGGVPGGDPIKNITADGSVIGLTIPLGGHHVDLFFETDEDPECVRVAREIESTHIDNWIRQGYAAHLLLKNL